MLMRLKGGRYYLVYGKRFLSYFILNGREYLIISLPFFFVDIINIYSEWFVSNGVYFYIKDNYE
jgi:hypothetical protein